jgi:sugar phosphate permease
MASAPTKIRWLVFVLASTTSFLLYLHRYTWGIVKVEVSREYGWDKEVLGWLDSAFMIGYAGGQIPGGMLGDWFGPRMVLGVIIVVWSLSMGAMGLARGVPSMATVRTIFGLAQAGCYPNLSKVTKVWFPIFERTAVQGWVASFFGRTGGAAALIVLGTFMLGKWEIPWRTALAWLAGAGCVFSVVLICLLRNSPRAHPWTNEAEVDLIASGDGAGTVATRGVIDWRRVSCSPVVWALLFQQFTCAFVDMFFSNWLPLYLAEAKGVKMTNTGWMAALPLAGGALGGMLAGGMLQNWLLHKTGNRRWSRSGIGLTGNLLAGVCLFVSLAFDSAASIVWVFFALKFFADWAQPTCWAATTDMGGRGAASLFAIVNTSGSLAGFVSGPVMGKTIQFFGSVPGDSTATSPAGWTALFVMIGIVYIASALSWLFIDCTKAIDSEG